MEFFKVVNWRKFGKIIGIITVVVLYSQISSPELDYFVLSIPILAAILLLGHSHLDYVLTIKPKIKRTQSEIRRKKLKKLNRRKWRIFS